MRLQASDLFYLMPELSLLMAAVLLTVLDLILPESTSRKRFGWIAAAGVLVSGAFVVWFMFDIRGNSAEYIVLLAQSYRIDQFANSFKLFMLAGTLLVLLMSMGSLKKEGVEHRGEYYYLMLPATIGGMIMASSADLITLFIGLELLSITSYILVGIRKKHLHANEAAFKYVVLGGIATAFILYGMSFLYGLSGSTNLAHINDALQGMDPSWTAIVYISFILILAGLAFKIAAAPFHAWAPDVYQGAATPVAAYLAVVSKAAGIAMLLRIAYNAYYDASSGTQPIDDPMFAMIAVIAAAAMIIGNTAALRQTNVKRLLALSAVANSGYLLVPVSLQLSPAHASNFAEIYFYFVAYLLMNIGAFAVLAAVSHVKGQSGLDSFAGLYYRAPFTAVAMLLFILSLAGIPISAGFVGKFYILTGAVQMQAYWLAAVMILTSVISYYYYFRIVRQMFLKTDSSAEKRITLPIPLAAVIWFCAVSTVVLGIFPQWLLRPLADLFQVFGDLFII